jgi:hypothetical protein
LTGGSIPEESLVTLAKTYLTPSNICLTLSALICIEDPKAIFKTCDLVWALRRAYGSGRIESMVGGKKSKGSLGSPAVVANRAKPPMEG